MSRFEFHFRVPACHPALPGHFPGNPIVPGVLMLDHVLAELRKTTGRDVSCLHQVKFTSGLRPEEDAHAQCEVDGERASFRLMSQRDGAVVTLATGSLTLRTGKVPPA